MRYLTDAEMQRRRRRDRWQHGKRAGRAVCPSCHQTIAAGSWVKPAPGGGGVIQHAYRCPEAAMRD